MSRHKYIQLFPLFLFLSFTFSSLPILPPRRFLFKSLTFGLPITGRLDTKTVTLILSPRCGVSDTHMIINNNGIHTTAHYTYLNGKPKWPRNKLTYSISKTHKLDYLTSDDVKTVFRLAFGHWARVIPVSFEEIDDFTAADIRIGFYRYPFEGASRTLAYAYAPEDGRLHLNAAETWVVNDNFKGSPVAFDLESVATHEIGHLLGLGHSSQESAIMYPTLPPRTKKVLTVHDVAGVQNLYGPNPNSRLDSSEESNKKAVVSLRFLSGLFIYLVLLVVVLKLKVKNPRQEYDGL